MTQIHGKPGQVNADQKWGQFGLKAMVEVGEMDEMDWRAFQELKPQRLEKLSAAISLRSPLLNSMGWAQPRYFLLLVERMMKKGSLIYRSKRERVPCDSSMDTALESKETNSSAPSHSPS